jgi:hypothetical protein
MVPTPRFHADRNRRLNTLPAGLLLLAAAGMAFPQGPGGPAPAPAAPVRVTIDDGKPEVVVPVLPVDPQVRIVTQYMPDMRYGFTVDGKRIMCATNGANNSTLVRIDGVDIPYGGPQGRWEPQQAPLKPGPFGKPRHGVYSTWIYSNVHITQTLEVVPSKTANSVAGQKRRLDTSRIVYRIENKDSRPHTVGIRGTMDIMIHFNDGALFASPATHPNQILDGAELKDKQVPEYLQVLERPNLQNPGFVAYLTFKMGTRVQGPDRIVMTNLGACFQGWEVRPIPANGDSAFAFFFSPHEVKPNAHREVGYAYGGGIATNPDNDGKVSLTFGGSFEPGKRFTVAAAVDDPAPGQTLALELPPGMERVEGKEWQPVPRPAAEGRSLVLWKARVLRTGRHTLKVRSSTGVTETRIITITRPGER